LTPEEQMITANPDIKNIDYKDDIDFVIIGSEYGNISQIKKHVIL